MHAFGVEIPRGLRILLCYIKDSLDVSTVRAPMRLDDSEIRDLAGFLARRCTPDGGPPDGRTPVALGRRPWLPVGLLASGVAVVVHLGDGAAAWIGPVAVASTGPLTLFLCGLVGWAAWNERCRLYGDSDSRAAGMG